MRRKRPTRPFQFVPFSLRQLQALTWWLPGSPYANADGVLAGGAIRSGKTFVMTLSFVLWSYFAFPEGQDFIMASKTMGALRRNVLTPLLRLLDAFSINYHYDRSSEAPHLVIGKNIYYLFGANNERSQDALQGLTAAGCLLDEVVLFPESFVQQAIGRCSVEGSKLWFTFNPGGPFHWFKRKFVDQWRKKRLLNLRFQLDDNPALSDRIKQRYRRMFSGVWFRRYILGQWAIAEGLVYDFDERRHIAQEVPTWFPHYGVAIDHGTTNATAFGLFGYGLDDSKVYLLNLYYYDSQQTKRTKTNSEYADDFTKWLGGKQPDTIICDPAAKGFIVELESRGYDITPAQNDVVEGIQFVRTVMGGTDPDFKVAGLPEMEPALMEFGTYAWDEKKQAKGEDVPIKEHDHALDMIRYFLFTVIEPIYYQGEEWGLVKA